MRAIFVVAASAVLSAVHLSTATAQATGVVAPWLDEIRQNYDQRGVQRLLADFAFISNPCTIDRLPDTVWVDGTLGLTLEYPRRIEGSISGQGYTFTTDRGRVASRSGAPLGFALEQARCGATGPVYLLRHDSLLLRVTGLFGPGDGSAARTWTRGTDGRLQQAIEGRHLGKSVPPEAIALHGAEALTARRAAVADSTRRGAEELAAERRAADAARNGKLETDAKRAKSGRESPSQRYARLVDTVADSALFVSDRLTHWILVGRDSSSSEALRLQNHG